MASNSQSFRTETTINVSQNAHSSPVNYSGTVPVQENVEVVEDSLKDIPEAYRGGAVKTPQRLPPDDEDDDDLYAVSPQAKSAPRERPAASKSVEPAQDDPSDVAAAELEAATVKDRDTQQVRPTKASNLIDGLLENGAAPATDDRPMKSQTSNQPPESVQDGWCRGVRNGGKY
jgi:hypothetical protein